MECFGCANKMSTIEISVEHVMRSCKQYNCSTTLYWFDAIVIWPECVTIWRCQVLMMLMLMDD